ncbi:hypothetical protein ACFOG5_11060 [Pedobacter fastidiosus]
MSILHNRFVFPTFWASLSQAFKAVVIARHEAICLSGQGKK